jgi:GxxExxY protein
MDLVDQCHHYGNSMLEMDEERSGYEAAPYKHSELTQRIIRVFYDVYNALGYGFLEKVYENAFALRLRSCGMSAQQQRPISVYFDGCVVGEYFADLVVDDLILVELKAANELTAEHEAQLLNYLRATKYEVGLLLNFGPKPRVTRKMFENRLKPNLKRS